MYGQGSFRFFVLTVVCFLFLTVTGQGAQGQTDGNTTESDTQAGLSNTTDTFDSNNDTETATSESDAGNETSSLDDVTEGSEMTSNETETTEEGGTGNTTLTDDVSSDNGTDAEGVEDVSSVSNNTTDTESDNATSSDLDFTPESTNATGEEEGTTEDPYGLTTTEGEFGDTMTSNDTVDGMGEDSDNTTAAEDDLLEPSSVSVVDESGSVVGEGEGGQENATASEFDHTQGSANATVDEGVGDGEDNATITDEEFQETDNATIADEEFQEMDNTTTGEDWDVQGPGDDQQNSTLTEPSTVEIDDQSASVLENDTAMASDNDTEVTDGFSNNITTDGTTALDNETQTTTVEEDTDSFNDTSDVQPDDDNTTMTSPGTVQPDDDNTTMTSPETDIEAENTTAETEQGLNTTDTVRPSGTEEEKTATVQRKPEKADFIVFDNTGKPCLLASLNITIWFKYHIQEGLIRETYTVSQKDEKDDSSYVGSCEENLSSLSITWNNNTFTLNLTFALEDKGVEERTEQDGLEMDVLPEGVNSSSSWSLHQVALSYDTSNQQFFPEASNPQVKTVEPATVNLFKTPLGLSYLCETPGAVKLQFKDVEMVFNYVRLEPFGPQSAYFANETVECSGDMNTLPMTESTTVPLVVAACLAFAVIVIIIGYAAHRCLTKHRHGEYKPMD